MQTGVKDGCTSYSLIWQKILPRLFFSICSTNFLSPKLFNYFPLLHLNIFCQTFYPHCLRINKYVQKMKGLRSQWNSAQINNRHPYQLKKLKSWEPFWSYLLNSTANPAHLPQNWPNWLNWQCSLAGSFKTLPGFLFF